MPIVATDNDVLSGRGRSTYLHAGNARLLALVRAHRPRFQTTKRSEKRAIAHEIINEIHRLGGRFLAEDPACATANSGLPLLEKHWIEADEQRTMKKVMHALREKDEEGPSGSVGVARGTEGSPKSASQMKDGTPRSTGNRSLGGGTAGGAPSDTGNPTKSSGRNDSQQLDAAHSSIGNASAQFNNIQPLFGNQLRPGEGAVVAAAAEDIRRPQHAVDPRTRFDQSPASDSWASSLSHIMATSEALDSPSPSAKSIGLHDWMTEAANTFASASASTSASAGDANHRPQSKSPSDSLAGMFGQMATDTHLPLVSAKSIGTQDWMKATNDLASMEDVHRPQHVDLRTRFDRLPSAESWARSSSHVTTGTPRSPPSAAKSIGIQDWMTAANDLASKNAYILGSIELAWQITNHLVNLVSDATNVDLQNMTAENVVIFVDPSFGCGASSSQPHMPPIHRVEFRTTLRQEGAPLQPPDACAALGKILLRLFSFGRSSSAVDFSTLPIDSAKSGNPPPQKRRAGNASTAANNVLLAAGMPLSIRRLVCDLLVAPNEQQSRISIALPGEALEDLTQMRSDPASFLWDRTCPEMVLEHFVRNGETLFGREKELAALMKAKDNVSTSVLGDGRTLVGQGSDFVCEAAFVGGYAGSGKSSLLLPLVLACNEEQWFVLSCKFDKQAAPVKVLYSALDDFFGKWGDGSDPNFNPAMMRSFREVCECICSTIDDDGFHQLSELVPNFTKMYPHLVKRTSTPDQVVVSSMDKVGSAKARLRNLIQVLFKSLCSKGLPVLLVLDDLQWCDSFVLEGLTEFIVSYMHSEAGASTNMRRRGLMLAGTYRSNEVAEGHPLIESINCLQNSQKANVTMLTAVELSKGDVTRLISAKLCLPWRYTWDLANVAHSKTRGNPFFIIHFLRSIVSNKMLEFSVKARRWVWDCDVVEMQMISDGVAELLAASFNQLPAALMQAMKIVSCLGYQVERPTIDALDSNHEVVPFSILDWMERAVKEGILEKAGPMYQFTHDIIQQTIYELIPPGDRKVLHKLIGQSLLKTARNRSAIHLLAVDQINMFCKDGVLLSPEERSQFAHSNAAAAKYAISSSSFESARSYVDTGIQLLEPSHWETQYSLSLSLFEMSASVSLISGDISTMSTCLEAVLSHVMTFEDSLKASSMLAKLLASNSKYDAATTNCLEILKQLGEEFPSEVSLPLVQKELPEMQNILRNITYDRIKALPTMADNRKINAMKFLNMLCLYCVASKPLLLPRLSYRMLKLTLEHGFCEDTIVGIATAGYSIFHYTDDIELAADLGRVSELLIQESSKKHVLRARLCIELYITLKLLREPWPSVVTLLPGLYNSAMLAGDIENALICRWNHSGVGYWTGAVHLSTVSEQSLSCIKEAAKHQQNMVLYGTMAAFQSCMHLTGRESNEVEIKSLDELAAIGEATNGAYLVWQTFMHRMSNLFWSRDFFAVAELSEKYSEEHYSASQQKRSLHVMRVFYEGITHLNLARRSDDAKKKWREMGGKAVAAMTGYATSMSKWNWENKALLLQAELHYLNGDPELADTVYQASIQSACEHKFIHEEALAYELHGRFCVENQMAEKGSNQLRVAVSKYKEWGATKKAKDVQLYLDPVLACMSLAAL